MSNFDALSSMSSVNIGKSSYESARSASEASSFSESLENAMSEKDDKKLLDSCQQFEGYFIQQLYKEMQKTVDSSQSLFKKSQATNTFTDFLIEEHSKNISTTGGIGIAKMMYDSMKAHQLAEEDPINKNRNI